MSSQSSFVRIGIADLDDREAALELLAVEAELEFALVDGPRRVVGFLRLPSAPVPDDHVAAAVLAFGNDALEVEIGDRVVFDMNGHAAVLGIERRSLGHSPADQHVVHLEAEVVVQASGAVTLDYEATIATRRSRPGRLVAAGLGCLGEVALAAVRL